MPTSNGRSAAKHDLKRTPNATRPGWTPRKEHDALAIIDRMIGDDEGRRRAIDEEYLKSAMSLLIYEARTRAGLTQKQLAEQMGTRPPVIARLEDADYDGNSLPMLQRLANALGITIAIEIGPAGKTAVIEKRPKRARRRGVRGVR